VRFGDDTSVLLKIQAFWFVNGSIFRALKTTYLIRSMLMVLNMNMLQSLDVEIHFGERLPPTSGRKMGIIGLSEILAEDGDNRFIRNIGK